MTVAICLKRARELVAGGWSEPVCRRRPDWVFPLGEPCERSDEGVVSFSVIEALLQTSTSPEEFSMALDTFRETATPTDVPALHEWLESPDRKLREVTKAFDLAILRAGRLH
jgi:hypothetical protein